MGFNSGFKGLKAGQNPPRFVGPIEKGKEEDYFEIFYSDTLMSIESSSISTWCLFKESRIFPPFWRTIQLYASFFLINLSLLGFALYSSEQDYLGSSVATHRL